MPALWESDDQQVWADHANALSGRLQQLNDSRLVELDRQVRTLSLQLVAAMAAVTAC